MTDPNGSLHHSEKDGFYWQTLCRKCRSEVRIRIGDLSPSEAARAVATLNTQPAECPGFHTELSGWRTLYSLDLMLEHLAAATTPVPT